MTYPSFQQIVKRFYHFKILRFFVLRFDIQKMQWKFQICLDRFYLRKPPCGVRPASLARPAMAQRMTAIPVNQITPQAAMGFLDSILFIQTDFDF